MVALFRAALTNNRPAEFDGAKFHGKERIRPIENFAVTEIEKLDDRVKHRRNFARHPIRYALRAIEKLDRLSSLNW